MSGIVIDLQREVLDSNVDTVTLLRKAYLVAKKLKLADFEKWADCELNGYQIEKTNIPQYRTLYGQLKAYNPYRGWIPVSFPTRKMQDRFSRSKSWDSIPSLVSALSAGQELHMPVQGETAVLLNEMSEMGFETNYSLFFNANAIESIVETVRNNILKWAILLEENDIIGDGIVFSKEEKKQAQQPQIIHYTNNFYGDVDNTQLQQGTSSSEQSR